MLSFGLQVILLLAIISGIIAYAGNGIGRFIGRQRLTLFNLRPRYTATAITVISGVVIALFTFASIIVISQDARVALFGLEKIRTEMKSAEENLKRTQNDLEKNRRDLLDSRKELTSIRKDLEKRNTELLELQESLDIAKQIREGLKNEIENARSGSLLFAKGEVILVTLAESGNRREVDAGLKRIADSLKAYLQKFASGSSRELLEIENYDYARDYIVSHSGRIVLKAVVDKNVVMGESVSVHYEVLPNELIYRKGELIAAQEIAEKKRELIEEKLKELLAAAHQNAKVKGIVPSVSGSIGSVPYARMFEVSKSISLKGKAVRVDIRAQKDVYSIGPLEVEFKIL